MKTIRYFFLILISIFFSNCETTLFEDEPMNDPEALFEDFWNTFDTDYAGFEVRGVDWQAQYERFRPQVNSGTTDEALKSVFKQLVLTLDDGHISLSFPGEPVFYANRIYDEKIGKELFDLELIKSAYMSGDYTVSEYGTNTYGRIGDIGYLHFAGFRANILEMDKILDDFEDAKGMIFDLRTNKGGDFTYAITEFARLTQEERLVFRSRTKNGPGKTDYTEWYEWYLRPEGKYFDKPIVVLIDQLTISAGERAVMILKTLPNVTLIGDTTNGALSTKIGKELANGWNYSVTPQQVLDPQGNNYEGSGIPPDIYMKNTLEEIESGTDRTLEAALQNLASR